MSQYAVKGLGGSPVVATFDRPDESVTDLSRQKKTLSTVICVPEFGTSGSIPVLPCGVSAVSQVGHSSSTQCQSAQSAE